MATGFEMLGSALGGLTTESSPEYEKGLALGAQTQGALAVARERVEKEQARSQLAEQLKGAGLPSAVADASSTALTAGAGLGDVIGMLGKQQEQGFRAKAADPNVPFDTGNRALMGVASAPVEPLQSLGEGQYVDRFNTAAGVKSTPLGDAILGQKKAQTGSEVAQADAAHALADSRRNGGGPAGLGKASVGMQWALDKDGNPILDENDRPTQIPITGGSKDPNAAAAMGSREAVFMGRITNSAKQASSELKNLMELPSGATTGILGVGATPGHSVMQSTLDTLRNKLSSEDVQATNVSMSGLSRALATIETSGLAPPGQFTTSFDSLALREGDLEETRLRKLATMRQIVDNGLETLIQNPRTPESTKKYMNEIRTDLAGAIPFTVHDVNALKKTPGQTLGQLAQSKGLGTSTSVAPAETTAAHVVHAVTGAPPSFATEQEVQAAVAAGKLKAGDKVTVGGVTGTLQ